MGVIFDPYKKGIYTDNPYNNIFEITTRTFDLKETNLEVYKNKVLAIINLNISTNLSNISNEESKNINTIKSIKSLFNNDLEILIYPTNTLDRSELSNNIVLKNLTELELFNNSNVKLNLFNKVSVFGEDTCEVYKYLLRNSNFMNLREGKANSIKSNLGLFLIDKKGKVHKFYDSYNLEELKASVYKLIKEEDKEIKIRKDFIKLGKYI